jgi:hypothetical protein
MDLFNPESVLQLVQSERAKDHERLRNIHKRVVAWCEDRDKTSGIDVLCAMREELDRLFPEEPVTQEA